MKLLFLTQLVPFPRDSGNKIIAYKILKILTRNKYVHLFCFDDNIIDNEHEAKYDFFLKSIYTEKKAIIFRKHPLKILIIFILSFFSDKPFMIIKYESQNMKKRIEELIINKKIRRIFVCNDSMMQYIPQWYKGKVIYLSVDLTSSLYEQYAKYENNLLIKILYLWESYKLRQYERKILKRANLIFSVSKVEFNKIKKIIGNNKKIHFLPIPFEVFKRKKNVLEDNILFIGSLTWRPNFDGLWWFLKKVFPEVIKTLPQIKLFIGSNDNFKLNKYKYRNHIVFIKNVFHNNKMSHYLYMNSRVFIVPILYGSGIRIKLLDSLSHGIPVVSTRKGVEGIGITDKTVLMSDNFKTFAKYTISLLTNRELNSKFSRNSQIFIKNNFNKHKSEKLLKSV